jgi:hypothetical protein
MWHKPLLIIIVAGAFALNVYNIGFPVGYHADEYKKAVFIAENRQDFMHPLLLLQLARLQTWMFAPLPPDQLVLVGRSISVVFGALLPFFAYLVASRTIPQKYALCVAASIAVSPIIVIHSHYFKEDILFTSLGMLALWVLCNFLESPTLRYTFILGLVTGLVFSSHYKAAMLLPVYLLAPLLEYRTNKQRWFLYRRLALALAFATYIFILVNWPLLFDPAQFVYGVTFEANHAVSGHTISISPWPFLFGFHFRYSLIPGLTMPLAVVVLAATAYLLVRWRYLPGSDRLLLVYALLFYFVLEASPLKPPPDHCRYMISIVPVALYVPFRAATLLRASVLANAIMYTMLVTVAVVIPSVDTLILDYNLVRDTRAKAKTIIDDEYPDANVLFDGYTRSLADGEQFRPYGESNTTIAELRRKGIDIVVVSSFEYDRYLLGEQLASQRPEIYEAARRYTELFTYPTIEVRPTYRSFAFSNPTIKIIDIRGVTARVD